MKLLELGIENVRGLPHMDLKLEGNNMVIWGPNGSGKSAVVDAIDFLLTGKIFRLTGKGTGKIHLKDHGPHIDHNIEEAVVNAVIKIPGVKEPVELKRCMKNPSQLEYDNSVKDKVEKLISIAQQGQHVLTRRDILKYITSEASTRAEDIQNLLNLGDVEKIRKSFGRARRELDKEVDISKEGLNVIKEEIIERIESAVYNKEAVLEFVNAKRKILGSKEISSLDPRDFKKGIKPFHIVPPEQLIDMDSYEIGMRRLKQYLIPKNQKDIEEKEKRLHMMVDAIRTDAKKLRSLSNIKLVALGIELIDDTGKCPLCDKPWDLEDLHEHLQEKLEKMENIKENEKDIKKLSESISKRIKTVMNGINIVIQTLEKAGLKDDIPNLRSWNSELEKLASLVDLPIEKCPNREFDSNQIMKMLAPEDAHKQLKRIDKRIRSSSPSFSPKQKAWDELTRLEEKIKGLRNASERFEQIQLAQKRATILEESFQKAREDVLGQLFYEINNRFNEIYQILHGPDEGEFNSSLKPSRAGIELEVDFYGRGSHPPHALHSEGHQDSMGVCLYLALAERLSEGILDLIILDDVVMSVDMGHRKKLCELLATSFPDKQFLITTHDKYWQRQLQFGGVVREDNVVEFNNWKIETGPQICDMGSLWERITMNVDESNIQNAAFLLRNGMEQFFAEVCDSLRVPVKFNLTGDYDLGELLLPAQQQYKLLLKKTRLAAQSWGKNDIEQKLEELDSIRHTIFKRVGAEQWAVNVNVHFNQWASSSKEDFEPVVDAFRDLYYLFKCDNCGGLLHVTMKKWKAESVRCNCETINWNLVKNASIS